MQKPRKFYHSPIYVDRHHERMEEMSHWRSDAAHHSYGWWRIWNIISIVLLLFIILIIWKLFL